MKDRMHDQGLDMLSGYGQDDLLQLVSAVDIVSCIVFCILL
jgi:hypothetical protein